MIQCIYSFLFYLLKLNTGSHISHISLELVTFPAIKITTLTKEFLGVLHEIIHTHCSIHIE